MQDDLKNYLDKLVSKYETNDFIENDPIRFPHRFEQTQDIEIAAFIASAFAYGKREVFIDKLNLLFEYMDNKPYQFVMNYSQENNRSLDDFSYRFSVGVDIIQIVLTLQELYQSHGSLESLFAMGWNRKHDIQDMLQVVVDYFYERVNLPVTKGFYHLLPNPCKNSACKRLNMLLRWLVRDGKVDIGIWHFMPKSELLIPLDTHVAKISRNLGLLGRQQNDFKSVIELMSNLKQYDSSDPVKYDFAMFGFGVDKDNTKTLLI